MSETNITGDVHGNIYSGNIGQVGDLHINTGGGNYYEGGTHHHHPEPLTWPLYINIPAPPTHFVGRDDLVHTLITQLRAGATTALSAEGLPGVGKTTLAVKLAHHEQIRTHFTDGVLWAGLGPNGDPALALSRWADALHLDLSAKPTTAARSAAVADAIGNRKLLIVLDDIWHLEHAQTLRLGGPASVHLLTTRDQRIAAAFGHVATVDVLTPEAARALFQTLAPAAYNADPAAADALLDAVGYLPLAIELLAGYLNAGASKRFANRTRQALDELTNPQRRLALATLRLGSHESTERTLMQIIALSLEGLAEEDETAVTVFHALGAFAPKPANFDLEAAVAVTGATDNTLALLADRNLLEIDQDEALSLHQTLADAARAETPAEAVTQHRDHYLALVNEDKEDWQRIGKIYPQIVFAWQNTPPHDGINIVFADSLSPYQAKRGLWQDMLAWLERSLIVAQEQADQVSRARLLIQIGLSRNNALMETQKALGYFEQALSIYRTIRDRKGEAVAVSNIGLAYEALGKKREAMCFYEQAISLYRATGNSEGEAVLTMNIGSYYADLGEQQKALTYYKQALLLLHGNTKCRAAILINIGVVYSTLGERQNALHYYEQALPLVRLDGDQHSEADTLSNIGKVYATIGEEQKALRYFTQALSIQYEIGYQGGQANTLMNIGAVYSSLGEKQKTLRYYHQAYSIYREFGDLANEAHSLNSIGYVYTDLSELRKALQYFRESMAIFSAAGDYLGERITHWNMALAHGQLDDLAAAEEQLTLVVTIDKAIGHPDLERDSAVLAWIRGRRIVTNWLQSVRRFLKIR